MRWRVVVRLPGGARCLTRLDPGLRATAPTAALPDLAKSEHTGCLSVSSVFRSSLARPTSADLPLVHADALGQRFRSPKSLAAADRMGRTKQARNWTVILSGRASVGYTPRGRCVTKVLFWTLCDGGSCGCVAVTQGVSQRDGSVALRYLASRAGPVQGASNGGGSAPPRSAGTGCQWRTTSPACVIRVPLFMGVKPALR